MLKPDEGTADLPAGRVRLCIDADKSVTEVDEEHVHRVSPLSPSLPAPHLLSPPLQERSLYPTAHTGGCCKETIIELIALLAVYRQGVVVLSQRSLCEDAWTDLCVRTGSSA